MTGDAAALDLEAYVAALTLLVARTTAFIAVFPAFSGRNLPRTIKIGLALALSAAWYPDLAEKPPIAIGPSTSWLPLALGAMREAVLGTFLGYVLGLLLIPAKIAGSYIGQEMGLTMATITDPSQDTSGQTNIVGTLLELLGIVLFFTLDIHQVVLATLHASLTRWPVGHPMPIYPWQWLAAGLDDACQIALLVAAPLAVCLFFTLLVLSVLGKTAPMINLFSVGLSLRLAVGLVGMLVFLPEMVFLLSRLVQRTLGMVQRLLG